MTEEKKKPSPDKVKSERKTGMTLMAIARKYDMDKMEVRDICKDVKRALDKPKGDKAA